MLSALQSGGAVSGPELAERLGVTVRTVRRDVERLRQLGYAIDSDVGVAGGYRLGSGGSAVPPLILDTEETVALAVCVHAAAGDSVVGVLPLVEMRSLLFGRFLVSLPFVNYGGVLADNGVVERALFDRAGAIAQERGLTHVELRHFTRHFSEAPARQHKVTMLLALAPDAEAMWAVLDRKVRNQVRKAEKSGLTCETGGRELIDAFYPVFAANMRDLGTPVYSRRLFDEVFAALPDRTRLFVVRAADGRPVENRGYLHFS